MHISAIIWIVYVKFAQSGLCVGSIAQPHHVSKGASGSKLSDGNSREEYCAETCAEMLGVNFDTAQKVSMLYSCTMPAIVYCSCSRLTLDATAPAVMPPS